MSNRFRRFHLVAGALALATSASVVAALQGGQVRITNGKVAPQPAGSPFVQSFRALVAAQGDGGWIGYTVPIVDGERVMCCFDGNTSFVNGTVSTDAPAAVPAGSSRPPTARRWRAVRRVRPAPPPV
jgi:hypothetical protein